MKIRLTLATTNDVHGAAGFVNESLGSGFFPIVLSEQFMQSGFDLFSFRFVHSFLLFFFLLPPLGGLGSCRLAPKMFGRPAVEIWAVHLHAHRYDKGLPVPVGGSLMKRMSYRGCRFRRD
ncbi:MAG: hypothetical protein PVG78_09825 [Desulfobacterales bacterium]